MIFLAFLLLLYAFTGYTVHFLWIGLALLAALLEEVLNKTFISF